MNRVQPEALRDRWEARNDRAVRAMAANKARLEAAGPSGLASDKRLSRRGYDSSPGQGYHSLGRLASPEAAGKHRRKRRRGAK